MQGGKQELANSQERTFGQNLNTWVQTIGIILAGFWAAYTFGYKEFWLPKSVPINISLTLQLKKIQTGSGIHPLIPIEMRISATNPSSRTTYLMPSAWIAWGVKMNSPHHGSSVSFDKLAVASLLNSRTVEHVERHSLPGSFSVVAVGGLFADVVLRPGETLARTVIFHVPPDKYDLIEVSASMPSAAVEGSVELEWTFDKDSGVKPNVYRVTRSGRQPLPTDKTGWYSMEKIGFQFANSKSVLSLWD